MYVTSKQVSPLPHSDPSGIHFRDAVRYQKQNYKFELAYPGRMPGMKFTNSAQLKEE